MRTMFWILGLLPFPGATMPLSSLFTTRAAKVQPKLVETRPHDSQLDLYGVTHPGLKRLENQDHFLLGTVHPQVVIHGTSLPNADQLPLRGQRLATMLLVADGVG